MNRVLVILGMLALSGVGYFVASQWDRDNLWRDDEFLVRGDRMPLPPEVILEPHDAAFTAEVILEPHDAAFPTDVRSLSGTGGLRFAEVADTGIGFEYDNGAAGEFHLAETLGGGVAAADYDRDGMIDLVFVDGGDPIGWPTATENRIALYRNRGRTRFQEVAKSTGCDWNGYGHGCTVGDVNNDGFDDLFFTGYQSTCLLLNLGDGTFLESTGPSGLETDRWCATAAFGDLDRDGDLDLYVTAYCDVPRTLPTPVCESGGVRIHCHPHHYEAVPDLLFENLSDGRFADRSESAGIAAEMQYGLGVVIVDLDHDGVPEIFVANDGDRNLLFERQGDWAYADVGITAGVAYSSEGQSMGSMGISCADWDGDGLPDLLTTNFIHERNVLFHNAGDLLFFDQSHGNAIAQPSRSMVGWAAVGFDADNDGHLDLFVANGHVTDSPDAPYAQLPSLFRGRANGEWELADSPGTYFAKPWHGRGALAADLTDDGRPDLVVAHIHDRPRILRNESPSRGNSIRLRLIGIDSNRSAAGARIVVSAGGHEFVRQIILSGGYLSSSTGATHVGVGEADSIDTVTIHWPSGQTQHLRDVAAGATVVAVEGLSMSLKPQSP